jgi:hypothetical protein
MLDLTDRAELENLLQKLTPVPGTQPPVYMFGSILIGYDKLEQIKVLARSESEPVKRGLLERMLNSLGTLGVEPHTS